MSYGYANNAPSYGYMKNNKPAQSPYYRAATLGAGGEPKNQAPFTTLASGTASRPTAQPAAQAQGYLDAAGHPVAVTQAQIDASNKANPQAAGANGSYFQGSGAGADPMAAPVVQYDYRTDPTLQEILAGGVSSRQNAESASLAGKRRIGQQYGDTALLNQLGDTTGAQAAAADPYNVYAQLKRGYDQTSKQADEQYNQNNLFWSGARELGQGQLAHDYQGQLADATSQEQQALGSIDQTRLAQILAADQTDVQAKRGTVQSLIDRGIAQGFTWTGRYDGAGNPIFEQPGGSGGGQPAAGQQPPANQPGANQPTDPGNGGESSGAVPALSVPGVGQTDNALIYALLGRKKQAEREDPWQVYGGATPPPGLYSW